MTENYRCGHPRTEENTAMSKRLGRTPVPICRTCKNKRDRRAYDPDKDAARRARERARAKQRRAAHMPPDKPLRMGEWADRALCLGDDTERYYQEGSGHRPADNAHALNTCRMCPVRQECLDYAVENREVFGIWGGTTAAQRTRLITGTGAKQ